MAAENVLDLELLAKFASGEGGLRTGALKRAGYIVIEITEAGIKALERYANGLHFSGRLEEEKVVRAAIHTFEESRK